MALVRGGINKPARSTYNYGALHATRKALLTGGGVVGLGALVHHNNKKKKEMHKMANENQAQNPYETLAWYGGAGTGLAGATAIGAREAAKKQALKAANENTRGLPADVRDAYAKGTNKALNKEMLRNPSKALVESVKTRPGLMLAGTLLGGAAGQGAHNLYEYEKMKKQANYDEMLQKQQEIVDMQKALQERRIQVQELSEQAVANHQAYASQPHAYGARLGLLGATTGLGAAAGAATGLGRGVAGVGAGVGLLTGLAAQPIISKRLDNKYPQRVETRDAYQESHGRFSEMNNRYSDEKTLRDAAIQDAAVLAADQPALYSKAVREVGDEFPLRRMNEEIAKVRQERILLAEQEAELKRLAIEEKKMAIQGAAGSNELTQEEIRKMRMKNQAREEKMNMDNKE